MKKKTSLPTLKPLVLKNPAELTGLEALDRIEELHFHEEPGLAHSEWFKVL